MLLRGDIDYGGALKGDMEWRDLIINLDSVNCCMSGTY